MSILSATAVREIIMKEILIKDPAFETLIRKKLKKETGEITREDMGKIDKFNGVIIVTSFPERVVLNELCDEIAAVSDISGIEYCENIQSLAVKAEVSDVYDSTVKEVIRKICRLKSLRYLRIIGSAIRNIEWISELPLLEELQMFNMQIIPPVFSKEPKRLKKLEISDSTLEGIEWICKVQSLEKIKLVNNNMPKALSFGGLPNLSELLLVSSSIEAIASFFDLPKLAWAALRLENISEINAVRSLTSLTGFAITTCHTIDLSPLSALKKLKSLHLGNNTAADFSILEELPELTELKICVHHLNELTPVVQMRKLNKIKYLNVTINAEGI